MAVRTLLAAMLLVGLVCPSPVYGNDDSLDARIDAAENVLREKGPVAALPAFERLAAEFNRTAQRLNEAITLHYIGECYWRIGDFDRARTYLDRALSMEFDLGNRFRAAKTLNVLGLLEWDSGAYDKATEHFTRAGEIGRDLNDAKLQGSTLNNLSLVYDELGEYHRSLQQYEQVLELYKKIDFPRGTGDTLNNIGRVHLLLGDYSKALEYFERSLEINESLDARPSMSVDLGNIATCYLGLGDVDTALEKFDAAIRLAEDSGLRYDVAYWLGGKGNALVLKGRYDRGLEQYRAMIDIYEQQGAHIDLSAALHDLGRLHMVLGDPASAEEYFSRAIDVSRTAGRVAAIALNLMALGDLEFRHGRHEQARALFEEARKIADSLDDKVYMSSSRIRIAQAMSELGEAVQAVDLGKKALSLAQSSGARPLQGEALLLLGDLERRAGRPAAALERYTAANRALTKSGAPEVLWQIAYGRGLAFEARGDVESAVEALIAAVQVIESVRDRLTEQRFRSGYLQDKYQVYVDLVRLQLELGRTAAAFATAERLRARSFAVQLDRGGWPEFSGDEQRKQQELENRIRQLRRALNDEETRSAPERRQAAIESFSLELLVAQREYQEFLDDRVPSADVDVYRPPDSARVQQLLADDHVLIEYVVGDDALMIFALTSTDLFAVTRATGRADIKRRIDLLRDLLRVPDDHRWIKPAASLADILTGPLRDAGWLDDATHLYLVPHSYLNYLPFAVLPQETSRRPQLLLDRFTLSYLPTATALFHENAVSDGPASLLAMAPSVTRLRHAPDEARSIDSLFQPNSRLLLGGSATESRLKQHAGEVHVLHLATHGYFNRINPLFSGIRLESDEIEDGFLEVHEVFDLPLNADLVTLSACDTALGSGYLAEVPAGDEFVGLTQAFLSAGSNAVIATLWEVDDRSTVDLMTEFYERLHGAGGNHDKSAALAAAQRSLRSDTRYRHPYYWAPFVLVGNIGPDNAPRGLVTGVPL